jgi:uncharacterized membrane protein
VEVILMVAGAALLVAALGVPLALGRVGPNPWYGFRTPRTLTDPEVWWVANRMTGWALVASGVVAAVLSAVVGLAWPSAEGAPVASIFAMCASLALGVLYSFGRVSAYVGDLDAGRIPGANARILPTEPVDGSSASSPQKRGRDAAS